MEISKRNRTELKSYFVKNSIPTESNFADLIDGTLNQKDDGIVKLAGDPLCIEASGDDASQKKVIHFYQSFADLNPAWTLNLNPRRSPNDPSSATLGFNINDGEGNSRLFIDRRTGHMGLGTTEPGAALDVRGSFKAVSNVSGERELRLEAPNSGNHRGDDGTQAASGLVYRVTSNPADGDPIFQVRSSGQAVRFFVEHNGWTGSASNSAWFGGGLANYFAGNIGIGTTNPQDKLDVNGPLRFNGNASTRIYGAPRASRNTVVLKGHWDELEVKGRVIDWTGSNLHIGFDNDHSGHHIEIGRKVGYLSFLSGGGTSESMRVTGGNVGIGTATPGTKLEVNGTIKASGGLRVDGTTDHIETDGAFYRHKDGQAYLTVDDNLYIRHKRGNVIAHFDTKNGRLGIGTTSPKAPLHVATHSGNIGGSNFRKGAGHTQYWSIGCYEWVGAEGFKSWSDARVKMNPSPLNTREALEIIGQLHLVDYQHIPEYLAGVKGRGVYAQELREILPDAVSTFPAITLENGKVMENFLSVDYEWIFVTGMAAIQELKKQHEHLRSVVQQLQKAFNAQAPLSS
jgi:hypothetical protein